jgi:uncharacterized membrane protein
MPYCCHCGTQVGAADRYCGNCGAAQPGTGASPKPPGSSPSDFAGFWNARRASLFCYIPWFGWIAAVIVLASDRFQRDYEVRFHAFQGLYLFVAWLLVDWVVSPVLRMTRYGLWQPMPHMGGGILHLLILAGWIVMLIKVRHGEHYRLPILGDLAERSVAEQRVG